MNRLAVFARAPVAGAVKSRLSPALPAPLAAQLYAAMLADTLEAGRDCPAGERTVWWADGEGPAGLAPGYASRAQASGELGERLAHAFATLLAAPDDRAVVIGSDAPAVASASLERAFAALDRDDVVLGPASDGGYWLIGLRHPHPELFADVPWSSDRVLAVTSERAAASGLSLARLEPLDDVDTPADVARLVGACARPGARACGAHVREALRGMGLLV